MKVGGGEWEGGYEGVEAFRERDFWKLWGKEAFSQIRDCVFWFVFFWFGVWVDCYRGASVAGIFGLRAGNPHRILELGSQKGSGPSWQGGKIRFWAEFG
jgi:hypothetical protein